MSAMVTPNSGAAVPRQTNIDMARGGVIKAICRLMQTIMPNPQWVKPQSDNNRRYYGNYDEDNPYPFDKRA